MLFDFSPDGVDQFPFFAHLAARWLGVGVFLAAAGYLARRLDDGRVLALAVAAVLAPEVWSEVGRNALDSLRLDGDITTNYGSIRRWIGATAFVLRLALLGALLVFAARRTAEQGARGVVRG